MNYKLTTLDFYDDGGQLLRKVLPEQSDIPDFVKTAEVLEPGSGGQLYALLLVDDGEVLQKYAMVDRGNTWLSVLYFGLNREKLPEGAQKVAAANLLNACHDFDIDPPDFLAELARDAAVVDTQVFDVTGQVPLQKVASAEKEEVRYAIERADGSKHYPLTDANDVASALRYFGDHKSDFVPRERREFAVKVAAAAKRGALALPEEVAHYASDDWNPLLVAHITNRAVHLVERDSPTDGAAKAQLDKLASAKSSMSPTDFAVALERFDRENGLDGYWDRHIADPYFSTLGIPKVAAKTYDLGVVSCTSEDIMQLSTKGSAAIVDHFGEKVAGEFVKNPIAVFESMPAPQKLIMARMAVSQSDWS